MIPDLKKKNIPGIAGSVTCSFVEYTAFYLFLLQEAHVNTCYKHFYYFVTEYNLVDKKELEPLVSSHSKLNPKSILFYQECLHFVENTFKVVNLQILLHLTKNCI